MNENLIEEEDEFLEQMGGFLCSHVRQLIKNESVVVRIVKESFESMATIKIVGRDNIKAFLVTTARKYSMNYLKQQSCLI